MQSLKGMSPWSSLDDHTWFGRPFGVVLVKAVAMSFSISVDTLNKTKYPMKTNEKLEQK